MIEQKHIDLFWTKVNKTDSCWTWTAYKDRDGYGIFGIKNKGQFKAHRFSLMLEGVDIPKGYVVMHHCDNPSCVRPEHLKPATVAENNLDKKLKGREARQKGESNAGSKLTESQVKDIRNRATVGLRTGYNNGSNLKQLAVEYKVCVDTIRLIAHKKIWKHI
jgi:hypothetical protein